MIFLYLQPNLKLLTKNYYYEKNEKAYFRVIIKLAVIYHCSPLMMPV